MDQLARQVGINVRVWRDGVRQKFRIYKEDRAVGAAHARRTLQKKLEPYKDLLELRKGDLLPRLNQTTMANVGKNPYLKTIVRENHPDRPVKKTSKVIAWTLYGGFLGACAGAMGILVAAKWLETASGTTFGIILGVGAILGALTGIGVHGEQHQKKIDNFIADTLPKIKRGIEGN